MSPPAAPTVTKWFLRSLGASTAVNDSTVATGESNTLSMVVATLP
jgi:hypothetical protein